MQGQQWPVHHRRPHHGGGIVAAAVIHHNDLSCVGLLAQPGAKLPQALWKAASLVVGGNDDRERDETRCLFHAAVSLSACLCLLSTPLLHYTFWRSKNHPK